MSSVGCRAADPVFYSAVQGSGFSWPFTVRPLCVPPPSQSTCPRRSPRWRNSSASPAPRAGFWWAAMTSDFCWPPYLWPILPAPSTSRAPCSCPPSVLVCPGFSVPWPTFYRLSLTRTNRLPQICLPKTHFLTRTIRCVLLRTNRLKKAVIQTWPR